MLRWVGAVSLVGLLGLVVAPGCATETGSEETQEGQEMTTDEEVSLDPQGPAGMICCGICKNGYKPVNIFLQYNCTTWIKSQCGPNNFLDAYWRPPAQCQ